MNPTFLVFLSLCILGLAVRTAYEVAKAAGHLDPKNKLVFIVVFIGMISMLVSWVFMCPNDPWLVNIPQIIPWLGAILIISGLSISIIGMIQLKGVENIDHLVTSGIFSKLRHPMYTGFFLWISGWVLYFGAGASLIVALIAMVNILYWRSLEEKKLLQDYGSEYINYRKTSWF